MADFTVNERVINFVQNSKGFPLTCNQLKAISEGSANRPRLFNGCIQALSYGASSQELEQVILNTVEDSRRRQIILTSIEDVLTSIEDVRTSEIPTDSEESDLIIKVDNINNFERVFKNAIDFGHQPCLIVEDCKIIWCTLLPFKCREDSILRASFAGDSRHGRGG